MSIQSSIFTAYMQGNFIYQKLGKKIIATRKKRGFSQEQLALNSDIDRTYIARMETGKANPTLKVLKKISKKLKIKLSTLLEGI